MQNRMEQSPKEELHICSCCHRTLPAKAFYANRRTHVLDAYCKECRKMRSILRHRQTLAEEDAAPRYPVITRTADRVLRMSLILHARQVVRDSMQRKRKRRQDEEEAQEE